MHIKTSVYREPFPTVEDLLPLRPENSIELEQLGLSVKTIRHFGQNLSFFPERGIPVFAYRCKNYNIAALSAYSCTYNKNFSLRKVPSFFYLDRVPSLVDQVIVCPDPIELMSYHQILRPRYPSTLLIAPSPFTSMKDFRFLAERFPFAEFHSIYPLFESVDILRNICLLLALNHTNFSLHCDGRLLELSYGKGKRKITLDNVNIALYQRLRKKKIIKLKNISFPANATNFNSVL